MHPHIFVNFADMQNVLAVSPWYAPWNKVGIILNINVEKTGALDASSTAYNYLGIPGFYQLRTTFANRFGSEFPTQGDGTNIGGDEINDFVIIQGGLQVVVGVLIGDLDLNGRLTSRDVTLMAMAAVHGWNEMEDDGTTARGTPIGTGVTINNVDVPLSGFGLQNADIGCYVVPNSSYTMAMLRSTSATNNVPRLQKAVVLAGYLAGNVQRMCTFAWDGNGINPCANDCWP
jgi:hypothetical protein